MYSKYREQDLKTHQRLEQVPDYRGFGLEMLYCMYIHIQKTDVGSNGELSPLLDRMDIHTSDIRTYAHTYVRTYVFLSLSPPHARKYTSHCKFSATISSLQDQSMYAHNPSLLCEGQSFADHVSPHT